MLHKAKIVAYTLIHTLPFCVHALFCMLHLTETPWSTFFSKIVGGAFDISIGNTELAFGTTKHGPISGWTLTVLRVSQHPTQHNYPLIAREVMFST